MNEWDYSTWVQAKGYPIPKKNLPEGWVPEGARFSIFAAMEFEFNRWEALIPTYSIAGMGDNLASAAIEAVELLEDYLMLCARDGKSFRECRRALPRETQPDWLREISVIPAEFAAKLDQRRL